jgi:hypothetical protein
MSSYQPNSFAFSNNSSKSSLFFPSHSSIVTSILIREGSSQYSSLNFAISLIKRFLSLLRFPGVYKRLPIINKTIPRENTSDWKACCSGKIFPFYVYWYRKVSKYSLDPNFCIHFARFFSASTILQNSKSPILY